MPHASSPLRIALVNDHPLVVQGLRGLLAPFNTRVDVVELDSQVDPSQPVDAVLYDSFAMEGSDQPSLERLVADPRIDHVIVFTWNLQPPQVGQAVDRGVSGMLSKTLTGPEIVESIERICAGERLVSPPPPEPADVVEGGWPGRDAGLTAREAEVVTLITLGLSNQEIAERTYLSINSVKSYIRTAYRTMGVNSRSQAVLWGMDNGMRPRMERAIDSSF